jgi:hypothetical protein
MASIRIKSKATTGGVPSGLTRGELAVNLADKTLYVGGTVGNSIYLSGVQTFNGLTGDVSGVTLGGVNVFTQLNTFSAGLSASGATLGRLVVNGGISASGGLTLGGGVWAPGGVTAGSLSQFGTLFVTGTINGIGGLDISGSGTTLATLVVTSGATVSGRLNVGGVLDVVSGVTLGSTLDVVGIARFAAGVSASGATLGTLVVNSGISASGGITLASPNLVGTPTATTAPIGDNSLRIATTAYVQQEIANEGVTSFNGRTGAVQGVSAAVPGDGISVSGATGTVTITNTGVTRAEAGTGIFISGNTGTVTITNTGALLTANTFTGLQTFTNGISAAGGITFNSLSHFTAGLSGSGATLGRLVVNNGISASGGVTFHNNVWVGGLLTANGGISAAGGVTFNNTLYVGGTLSVQNNISYGGDLIRNGQAVSIISTYGTTSDLPRPGVQGEVAIVSGPIADYGMYLWDGGVSFEFGGVTGAWIRITNQNRYAWNPDADSSGVVDGADLSFLLAAWGEYSRYVAGGGGGDSTTLLMGIGDNLANAFEVKVYGATAGKKTSAFRITSNDAVPQISMNAGTVQMNSDLTISPVGDYTTTISQVTGVIQTGFIHATGFTAGGKGSTFDGNLTVGNLLTLNGGLSAGGATFTAPVYMGATLTMNSNIRFNSGYGITGGFVDAGWY